MFSGMQEGGNGKFSQLPCSEVVRLVLDEATGDMQVPGVFRVLSGLSFNLETANFVWFNLKELIIICFSLPVCSAGSSRDKGNDQ